ncbi:hypothetical protein [Mycobacterium sp. TY815]|uniref:hypothetical protein n=1 Tax=Mycobacterium sp. TY815 TaxID=3050581 RepID=UPI000FC0A8B4|nr:hypothetical protein [Mycobacterium sp. TY815]MDP7701774.1 hypothetical protein [Mycobacterium sp. TY815]RUP01270.1 MAG: hypothetical protein EKK34_30040 [Mycobacterium sp.]
MTTTTTMTTDTMTTNVIAPQQQSCSTLHLPSEPKLADQHVHCALAIGDLTLDVSSDLPWSFSLQSRGSVIQRFREPTEEVGGTGVAPLLQDIDDSGTPVLLVVTGRGGTGGEPMAVWRMTASRDRFVRAGEMFGFRQFYRTTEGFFGNYAHSSAASGSVTLYRWADDKLVTVAVLDTQAAAAPGDESRAWVRTGDVLCALSEDDDPPGARAQRTAALQAAGVNPATAQQQLCTQSWVASIYRGGR